MGNSFKSFGSNSESVLVSQFIGDVSFGTTGYWMQIVIRSLYHLKPFKVPFMKLHKDDHDHTEDCVFCPLKKLFKILDEVSIVEIDEGIIENQTQEDFRKYMFKFKKLKVKNVTEAFESFISMLNKNVKINTFNIASISSLVCENKRCKTRKDFDAIQEKTWKIKGNELIQLSKKYSGKNTKVFEELIKMLGDGNARTCPKCHKKSFIFRKWVIELPYVLTLSIDWEDHPNLIGVKKKKTKTMMKTLLSSITPIVIPDMLFRTHEIENITALAAKLVAIVCDRKGSSVAYFYNSLVGNWCFIQGDEVEPLSKFKSVSKHMYTTGSFPTLLFYEICKRKHDVIRVVEG